MRSFESLRQAILAELSGTQKTAGTVVAVVIPTILRVVLGHSANPVPFVTYFPAVLIAAVLLGWRWATLAMLVSAMIVNRIFLTRPWLQNPASSDIAILIFFALSCALLILIGDTLRRAVRETERLSRERDVLAGEMFHRVQNVLSVTAAMIQMNRATNVTEFREDVLGRIHAFSKANRVLLENSVKGHCATELVGQAVAPFGRAEAIFAEGPPRQLPPKAGYQLLLILHELGTNALKHGALSVPTGQVHISWTGEPDRFHLEWREGGVGPVSAPAKKGMGSKLLAGQSCFAVAVRYEHEGVAVSVNML